MRRISFELHGVTDKPALADPFRDATAVSRPFARDNLVHLCTVVQEISALNDLSFELRHPEILDGGSEIEASAVRDMYRRWADQALSVLSGYPLPKGFLGLP
jgi:hypothetical protein